MTKIQNKAKKKDEVCQERHQQMANQNSDNWFGWKKIWVTSEQLSAFLTYEVVAGSPKGATAGEWGRNKGSSA